MSKFLVYTCCFYQEIYTDIVCHMINSFMRTNSSVDLLVYTTTEYKDIIEKKCPLATNIIFVVKNFYKTMNQARISKLDIFDFPQIDQYEKILYVDADSIFLKKPDEIFDQITDEVVYTVGEGEILNEGEYWGRSLFLKENTAHVNREGMGAYALGFKNLVAIKKLFIKIKQSFYLDMYQNKLRFYDQPFLNFYLIQNSMCNTEVLKSFVRSRPSAADAVNKGVTIVHFAGCPGHGNVKIDLINEFQADYEKIKPAENDTITFIKLQLAEMREKITKLETLLMQHELK